MNETASRLQGLNYFTTEGFEDQFQLVLIPPGTKRATSPGWNEGIAWIDDDGEVCRSNNDLRGEPGRWNRTEVTVDLVAAMIEEHDWNYGLRPVGNIGIIDADKKECGLAWEDWFLNSSHRVVVRTRKGRHLFVRLEPDLLALNLGKGPLGDAGDFIFPGEAGYALGLGSVADGVERTADHLEPGGAVDSMTVADFNLGRANLGLPPVGTATDTRGTGERSKLADLLANPATPGNRNDWLSRVAGHYATMIPYRDAYEATMRGVNASLAAPVDDTELHTTIWSIWETEQAKPDGVTVDVPPTAQDILWPDPGPDHDPYVRLVEGRVVERWWRKLEGEWLSTMTTHFDWLLAVERVGVDSDDVHHYRVSVTTAEGEVKHHWIDLSANGRNLGTWCTNHGLVIGSIATSSRKARRAGWTHVADAIVEAGRNAPSAVMVDAFGWDIDGSVYVGSDGVIGPGGFREHDTHVPSLRLENESAQWLIEPTDNNRASRPAALSVLTRYTGYHHAEVAGPFACWWAACLARPLIRTKLGMFPHLFIAAASGAGKSQGMFTDMVRMLGVTSPGELLTIPAARNALSWNRNAPLFIDDPDDAAAYDNLLRVAITDSSLSKMAADNSLVASYTLVRPAILASETLDMGERALQERAILLEPSSPNDRQREDLVGHDSDGLPLFGFVSEWDLIRDEQQSYDFERFVGHYLTVVMERNLLDLVDTVPAPNLARGREEAMFHTLAIGREILAGLIGEDQMGNVDAGLAAYVAARLEQATTDYLTSTVLPAAVLAWSNALDPDTHGTAYEREHCPLYLRRDRLLGFHVRKLATWWAREQRGQKVSDRRLQLGGYQALLRQAQSYVDSGRANRTDVRTRSNQSFYFLDRGLSDQVLDSANVGRPE